MEGRGTPVTYLAKDTRYQVHIGLFSMIVLVAGTCSIPGNRRDHIYFEDSTKTNNLPGTSSRL